MKSGKTLDDNFKSLLVKTINDFKGDTDKLNPEPRMGDINLKETTDKMDKIISNMAEKVSKEKWEILKTDSDDNKNK